MAHTIQTDSFLETGGSCTGLRDIRNQKSRETTGVTLQEVQDKYTTEFEIPYLNVKRYIKEINNDWNRLNPEQRKEISSSLELMKNFKDNIKNNIKENFGDPTDIPTTAPFVQSQLDITISYFKNSSAEDIENILDILFNPTDEQRELYELSYIDTENIKISFYEWGLHNYMHMHNNWKSGSVLFFLVLTFLLLGVLLGSFIN